MNYYSYNPTEITNLLNNIDDKSEDVVKFFNTFSFNTILNHNNAKDNSLNIFKNVMKEDTTKTKIVQLLNKLHNQNLDKIIQSFREISFQTIEELGELVFQIVNKIKRDSEQSRMLVMGLCLDFIGTYFINSNGDKIYFKVLLFNEIKNEYLSSVDYDNDNWKKDRAEKSMILIGTLFNFKIMSVRIMSEIIEDFKKVINYNPDGLQEDYERTEKAIQILSHLISTLAGDDNFKNNFSDFDNYLEEQINIYEDKKCISKKIRLVGKNCIFELRKTISV